MPKHTWALVALLLICGCDSRENATDGEAQNWFTTGRTLSEDHYSPLDQINTGNVKQLGFAWQYDLQTTRGATPRLTTSQQALRAHSPGTFGS
jgi:glucose dehydrogenase